ncbi:dodecenoyl-CoA isomerase [Dimargaris verticillata]|uniref:Dodecenoyl-CoA isomerase n=1 Tax=Dimargaris verticillata TaxID=2761393 RepID=A0A9W8AX96_9FUNG|nr:dodecenoyl-CoA isomerase [Dimargaris verticillata]
MVRVIPRVTHAGARRLEQLTQHLHTARKPNHAVRLVTADNDPTVAILSFGRAPANAFTYEFLRAVGVAVNMVVNIDPKIPSPQDLTTLGIHSTIQDYHCIRSLILTSDQPNFYSAGIDITVFLGQDASLTQAHPDAEPRPTKGVSETQWKAFWGLVRDVYITLYNNAKVRTVAAINGHSPGLGCILALACHDRIMAQPTDNTKQPTIGLNEVKVGLPLPIWLSERFAQVCGQRYAEKELPFGAMFSPQEALRMGLVDKVVETPPESVPSATSQSPLIQAAVQWVRGIYAKLPPASAPNSDAIWVAQMLSYRQVRRELTDRFYEREQEDLDASYSGIASDAIQNTMQFVLRQLQKRN